MAAALLVSSAPLSPPQSPPHLVEEVIELVRARSLYGISEVKASTELLKSFDKYASIERLLRRDAPRIGATAVKDSRRPYLIVVGVEDSAFDAGLRVGDRIVRRKGDSFTVKRGEETVKLRLREERRGARPSVVAKSRLRDGILYARLSEFGPTAAEELDVYANGEENLILDLRGNPGGQVTSALQVADLFVSSSQEKQQTRQIALVETADGSRETISSLPSSSSPLNGRRRRKVALLVDRDTKSAAELVAAAIQDTKSGVVIGERTFGKGAIQDFVPLQYSPEYAARITVGEFLRKDGSRIEGNGIVPDVLVESEMSELESLFLAKGVFFDFADSYNQLDKIQENWSQFLAKELDIASLVEDVEVSDDNSLPRDVAARASAGARTAAADAVRSNLGDARSDPVLLSRAEQAIRARILNEGDARLSRIQTDPLVRVAADVLDGKRPSSRKNTNAPARKKPRIVSGYDPDAQCLALQKCDTTQFVYVVPL